MSLYHSVKRIQIVFCKRRILWRYMIGIMLVNCSI
jgi:hypothetical protein